MKISPGCEDGGFSAGPVSHAEGGTAQSSEARKVGLPLATEVRSVHGGSLGKQKT